MAIQTWYVFKSESSDHLHDDGRFLLAMHLASPIPRKRARIEIIPLIDIMFFLLASFMMVSLSQTHMKGIKVALPSAAAPPSTTQKDFLSIQVREGNTVYFDAQYVADDEILPQLYKLHEANPGIKVSISATMLARHGDVITVLDKVRRARIEKVGYQIRAAKPGAAAPAVGNPPPPPPH
jgi:biopolymer transport protein ExbD